MRIRILNRFWSLRFAPNLANRGDCDPPDKPGKEIRVSSALKGEERLEVIVHELVHAAGWYVDEKFVERFAGDAARVLWRLARHSDINLTMNTYTMLQVLDQAAAVESLPPVPSAVSQNQKPDRDSPSQRDPETSGLEQPAASIDPASLPPDVARILAAWEQLPADVKARLTDRVDSATKLRLA